MAAVEFIVPDFVSNQKGIQESVASVFMTNCPRISIEKCATTFQLSVALGIGAHFNIAPLRFAKRQRKRIFRIAALCD